MNFVFQNKKEQKLVLVVRDIERIYNSFSQEFIELRAYGWAVADPLPYRYYFQDGQYHQEVISQFAPNFLEFFLPKSHLNPIYIHRCRELDRKLKLIFFPPELLPYEYDLELGCLKILVISMKYRVSDKPNKKYDFEYIYHRAIDLPYEYVYDKENNLGMLLVTKEVYLDDQKIFTPASLLP